MKILIVGGSGVLGRSLAPLLCRDGHHVVATRFHATEEIPTLSAEIRWIPLDLLDVPAVNELLLDEKPEIVFHLATALQADLHPRKLRVQLAQTNRLRDDGTRILQAAARYAGVRRVIGESIAFAYAPGPDPADEDTPFVDEPLAGFQEAVAAVRAMEKRLLAHPDNVILRLGMLYGAETSYAGDGATAQMIRKRQFPLVRPGSGRFSFLHVADAADALRRSLDAEAGIFNICENHNPAANEWLPAYAEALGAPRPFHVPRWLGRLAAGPFGDFLMNRQRGASNVRAREVMGWQPGYSFMERPLG